MSFNCLFFLTLFFGVFLDSKEVFGAKIHSGLLKSIQTGPKNIVISFGGIDKALQLPEFNEISSRSRRASLVYNSLKDLAKESQQNIIEFLTGFKNIEVTSQWITNTIHVGKATPELIAALEEQEEDIYVREAVVIHLEKTRMNPFVEQRRLTENEWGIIKVNAPDVWKTGNTGEGIVVASIDTGVRVTHETVRHNYRKEKGFYDPYNVSTNCTDVDGHGTHTMASIVGKNGVGVAPGATWFTCRGCDTMSCTEKALVACGQFILCPHDVNNPNNKDCSKSPHVVSNSWGGRGGKKFYEPVVAAWRQAGIIPTFANGNEGPQCKTAGSPGDYPNVIAVGSLTNKNTISKFSSQGPTKSGLIKPDITAPGSDIRSASYKSDTGYTVLSGTSMATPHVTGVIALLLSEAKKTMKKTLTYDQVYQLLTTTADTKITHKDICTENKKISKDKKSNAYGYGIIDALKVCTEYTTKLKVEQEKKLTKLSLLKDNTKEYLPPDDDEIDIPC